MNYKISIIDDSLTDTEYVAALVGGWGNAAGHTLKILTFPSAEAFLFQYEEERDFDILLLDIEMKEMNGVDLAKRVRQDNNGVQIVFITGYPDFMGEGYEVAALHYLLKPVSGEKLYEVLDRAAANLARTERRLAVTYDRRTELVPLSQILYIEAQKQYVLIHTFGETYRMKQSFGETIEELDEFFFKCQRSFCVNLRHVTRIKSSCVALKNGEEIPVGRGMAEKIGKEIIRLFP
ncbi:MAG: LytTR family DNA-binding domain-containing protein [Firmicutes bacterium]|nr:LytTR family DNA-binding domain-containing protein [Bacillota bacterium]